MRENISNLLSLYRYSIFLFLALVASCGSPDLSQPEILEKAKKEAIPIDSLSRKLMYGMMQLYVDGEEIPFTGWVKELHSNRALHSLGYLRDGRKQGIWISWYPNGKIEKHVGWKNDYYQGIFQTWHKNGNRKVIGQTTEGEMDGEWKGYYMNGQIGSLSLNKLGQLIRIEVWQPDGKRCLDSRVENGTGQYLLYDEKGKVYERREFEKGIQINLPE